MNKTSIEYLDYTWTPIAMRCTPISAGCANCWHIRMANRLAGNPTVSEEARAAYAGGPPVLIQNELNAPLRLRKPAIIGVQFMGDLFHPDVPDSFIFAILAACHAYQQHNFLILTKRPARLLEFWRGRNPLRNIWYGVSVEDQATADERIPVLERVPAAHRFISYEPLLGPISIQAYLDNGMISWVIAGGETGFAARPCDADWVRSIRDQCKAANLPFFFKRWGDKIEGRKIDGMVYSETPEAMYS